MTYFQSELFIISKQKWTVFSGSAQRGRLSFPYDVNAALLNTWHVKAFFLFLWYTYIQLFGCELTQAEGWQRSNSIHKQQKNEWGKNEEKEERPSTCSTGLRPDSDLAGRGGGQSWLEPAISSWYQCSKSSLGRWGLLPSDWYCRAHRRAAKSDRTGERVEERKERKKRRRQEEIRKHSKTAGRR